MGGGGETVLVSAVVRELSVLEYFRGGIFLMSVGRGAKNRLLPLLQGLAREMGAAPAHAPHGNPGDLDSLEHVMQHLTTVVSTGTSPRLVVLDDVLEREVVEALLPLGLKLVVTTRDRSVVGVPGGCLEVGDMTEEEALELLMLASGAVSSRIADLPLAMAVIGAMDESRESPHRPDTWTKLHEKLSAKPEFVYEEGLDNGLGNVLELSFSALDADAKERFRRLGVLAGGALAPMEMLSYLWDQGPGNSLLFVGQLVDKSLVQAVEHKYRLHDLVLAFVKSKLCCLKMERVVLVTSRLAQYLSRLSVLQEYAEADEMQGGLFALMGLWGSVEELSRDNTLQTTMYGKILSELEACEATADTAISYGAVGNLFFLQVRATRNFLLVSSVSSSRAVPSQTPLLAVRGKYADAEPLCERSPAIREKVLGPEHPDVAQSLNNRAGLLQSQGKYSEAEPLYVRAIAIGEKDLGPEHPDLAVWLNNRAGLFRSQTRPVSKHDPVTLPTAFQGKYEEAEPLYKRSLAIDEKVYGPDHPEGKYAGAVPLNERATEIWMKAFGPEHPTVATALNNRAWLLESQVGHRGAPQ
ncbi:unnamed protein product [Ectocarpus sp. CCAP 1310/34]|nr:unnamed protein product [Ectocarpus sp. CCAP 1310/34]